MNGELWRITSFVLVGLANTVLDFAVYNALTSRRVHWSRIQANMVSTTVAMMFSFTLNLLWVFNPDHRLVPDRAWKFIVVTALAVYGVQTLIIWLCSKVWPAPVVALSDSCANFLPARWRNREVLNRNLVKLLATGASLVWNYLWYRFYVFH